MGPGRILAVGLLLVLALVSAWLYRAVEDPAGATSGIDPHRPDYWFEGISLTAMDTGGRPRHRVKAAGMVHHPDDDSSVLKEPALEIFRDDGSSWRASALRGEVSSQAQQVHLEGDVRLERPATQDQPLLQLATGKLLIEPEREYIETASAVVFTSPGLKVEAVGLRAYLKEERIELLSKVRGVYTPGQ